LPFSVIDHFYEKDVIFKFAMKREYYCLFLPFTISFLEMYFRDNNEATVAQQAEQLICNQRVGGSIPFGGSTERFPSGQREQTVNLPAQPSEVRILPSPPAKFTVKSDK
jgi:hypothetical protein